jgi:hypothetical protein
VGAHSRTEGLLNREPWIAFRRPFGRPVAAGSGDPRGGSVAAQKTRGRIGSVLPAGTVVRRAQTTGHYSLTFYGLLLGSMSNG